MKVLNNIDDILDEINSISDDKVRQLILGGCNDKLDKIVCFHNHTDIYILISDINGLRLFIFDNIKECNLFIKENSHLELDEIVSKE